MENQQNVVRQEVKLGAFRNFEARAMKQRAKKFAHKNDRRKDDAKRSWKRDEW